MNTCLYLDSRWNLCFTLTTTTSVCWKIRKNVTVKGTCEGIFIKVAGCNFTSCNFTKINFFCRFSFTFWQKAWANLFLDGYIYLLFSLKLFWQKNSVLLKLPCYRDLIHPTKSILRLIGGHSLLVKDVTLCSNNISLNITVISAACHWIVSRYIIKHLRREWGKVKYGSDVISILLPFSNNFSRDNYHI